LRDLGLEPLESRANFVFVPLRDALRVAARMRELGVAVRPFADLPLVSAGLRASGGAALRISVGPWTVLQTALDALETGLRGEG
jgi:histidinol-phosphate/aromatic aminotransferase/cobyric acid decarboxylase-like protein